jgi:aryl-alcohol dehydrogenase-like predicted oxidoreductase
MDRQMLIRKLQDGTMCSALGFGCSAVMGRASRKKSLEAMGLAFDAGVNLFDTARSYGYGDSEAVLGEFSKGRRNQILISTKFGIRPSQRQTWKRALRPAARLLLKAVPQARGAVRARAGSQLERGEYTAETMRKSLEESLVQLRTDYVDFFFLHEIQRDAMAQGGVQDELFSELEKLREQGKVRWIGVSSSFDAVAASIELRPEVNALQMPANFLSFAHAQNVACHAKGRVFIGNHLFGGADGQELAKQKFEILAQNETLPPGLREKLKSCADSPMIVPALMDLALRGLHAQAVLTSMIQPEHISINIAAVENPVFSDVELEALAGVMARELRLC